MKMEMKMKMEMEMEMDLDFNTNSFLDDSIYELGGGDPDSCGLENERCGICMDVIIDRGLLDCCHHWFCFGCIDNWATITNLCPLCQNEFQLITCVPVYDTIGGGKVEDDSLSRDDDWCIQGTNNTLSFPSYYIDENAVICLDGNGCKIRNGVATGGDDTILDTSIACDSCDIWYHAFCVEFDPESTSENSWLCPRCIDEVPHKSAGISTKNQFCPETASCEQPVKASHSGIVSVSVADAGETAVVVSMIEGNHWVKETHENCLQAQDIDQKNQTVDENSSRHQYLDAKEQSLALSLSQDTHFAVPCDSLPLCELETGVTDGAESEPSASAKCAMFSGLLSDKPNIESKIEWNVELQLGLSVRSSLPADKMNNDAKEDHKSDVSHSHKLFKDSPAPVDGMSLIANEVGSCSMKRKSMSSSGDHDLTIGHTEMDYIKTGDEKGSDPPTKIAEGGGKSQQTCLNANGRKPLSGSSQDSSHLPADSKYEVDNISDRDEIVFDPSPKKAKGGGKSQQTCLKANGRKPLSESSQDSSHLPADSNYEVDDISDRDEIVADPSPKKAKGSGKSQQTCLKANGRKPLSGSSQDSSHLPADSKYEVNISDRDEIVANPSPKKAKGGGKSQQTCLKGNGRKPLSGSSQDCSHLPADSKYEVNISDGDEIVADPSPKKAKGGAKSQQTCLKANGRKPLSGISQDSSHLPADSKYEVDNISDRDETVADPSPKKAKDDRRSQRAHLKDEGRKPIPGSSHESSHLPAGSKYKVDSRYTRNEIVNKVHGNKTKAAGKSQQAQLKPDLEKPVSGSTQECAPASAGSKDDKLRDVSEQQNNIPDIMSIVRETNQRRDAVPCSPAHKSLMERETGAKLRVKKIMRRAAKDESSKLVENLRKDIREAVRTKATNDFSKSNLFDPKLLLAFRNAIARPRTELETVKRLNPSIVRAKKSMLQKGKIRENLTKKIYGNSNGKRKRAWDRDWEVEFWKHRCKRATKPEKVETLKSVLDLLRRSSDSSEMENEPGEKTTNPILSRLYLADTSVFPRKDDIKPLSALTRSGNDEINKEIVKEVFPKPVNDKNASQTPSDTSKNSSLYSKNEASCKKVFSDGSADKQSTTSLASGSEVNDQSLNEMPSKSDVKSDKRKWALEVLARKTSTIQRTSTQEKDEDDCMLKGKFPLLAQLPSDMRPVLAPCRHNKVPTPVRQAQLYRLTEHFLRKADLPTIRRTADTELAVADAVNIEKDVVNRSNSKLVYLNLCSQVVSQHMNNNKHDSTAESDPSEPVVHTESMDPAPRELSDLSAEAALRMAGLVSDSPPNSPCQPEVGNTDQSANGDKGPENLFDMDSHAELDIYGDFEYDLASEDYIGGVVPKVSKIQTEEGDSKLKVVFSSFSIQKTDDVMHPKDNDRLETVNEQKNSFCHGLHQDIGVSTLEVRTESSCPQPEPLHEEIDGEPSYAECEELYGPDKEPLLDRFQDKASRAADISTGKDILAENLGLRKVATTSDFDGHSCEENICVSSGLPSVGDSSGGHKSSDHSLGNEIPRKEKKTNKAKQSEIIRSISRKVEAYIKEHIRPLCKSGVISIEQYRWAVEKTTAKIMKYHSKDSNANFLIKEGEKVKKLAEQYVEAAQKKDGS